MKTIFMIPFVFIGLVCNAGTTATRDGGYPTYKLGDTAIITVTTAPNAVKLRR